MIKNIIFDVGAVLVAFEPERVLQEMGLDEAEVKAISEATTKGELWAELDRGVLPKEEVFEKMLSVIPQKYHADTMKFLNDGIKKTVTSYPYAADWICNLKNRGYKIYILSNYPFWLWDFHWKNEFTFTQYIDGKVVSGFAKMIKPQAEIYQKLLSDFSLIPQESVFIDDRKENIDAAIAQGINGIVFTNFEEAKKKLEKILSTK